MKNIIICCDGTGNHVVSYPSNVMHLFTSATKIKDEQICYYNAGLGTTPISQEGAPEYKKLFSIMKGLAFGAGLKGKVRSAYEFLADNYSVGDRVYLFGFSRGAYTVRVLAGFVYMYGLVGKENFHLFDYAFDLYSKKHDKEKNNIFRNAHIFKKSFSSSIEFEFMGLWDTVSSIGWFYDPKSYPYTKKMPNVKVIRHALAYHETRVFYQPVHITKGILTEKKIKQDVEEMWFCGVHSDVGGSYHDDESGLAMLSLMWILSEASKFGLQIEKNQLNDIIRPRKHPKKWTRKNVIHNSNKGIFKLMELFPRFHRQYHPMSDWYFAFKTSRKIREGDMKHSSFEFIQNKMISGDQIENIDLSEFYDDV